MEKYMNRRMQNLIITAVLAIGIVGIANAILPEPQDPQAVANMSFDERLKISTRVFLSLKISQPGN